MRRVAARAVSVAVLVIGLAFGVQDSALAVLAGQLCANADADTVTTADNGATVQCTYNPSSNRHQWVAIGTATTVVTIPTSSSAAAPATERSSSGNSGAASDASAQPDTQLLPAASQTATTVTAIPATTATTATTVRAAPATASAARPLALTG